MRTMQQQAGTLPREEHLQLGLKPRPHVTRQPLHSPLASLGVEAPQEAKVISVLGPEESWRLREGCRTRDGAFDEVELGGFRAFCTDRRDPGELLMQSVLAEAKATLSENQPHPSSCLSVWALSPPAGLDLHLHSGGGLRLLPSTACMLWLLAL